MNTLLVDIGNTRVKWAVLRGNKLGRMQAALHAGKPAVLRALVRAAPRVDDVVAVCVMGARLERVLAAAVKQRFGITPRFIRSTRTAMGVRSGYRETWRLGADRWVGAIGAFDLARGAVVVANIGTALTIDAVTAAGKHLGGAIVPGPSTMIESLLAGTHGIRRRARGGTVSTRSLFAADTANALGAGATYAAAAFIDRAVAQASAMMRVRPLLILTGGAAPALRRYIKSGGRVVPDLVLRGLAALARDTAGD
jgi:type III pantothenate kinase